MISLLLKLFPRFYNGSGIYAVIAVQHYYYAPIGKISLVQIDTCFDGKETDIPQHYHPIEDFSLEDLTKALSIVREYNTHQERFKLYQLIDPKGRILAA